MYKINKYILIFLIYVIDCILFLLFSSLFFLVLAAAAQHFNFMLGHISWQATMPFGLARTSAGASGNSCQLAPCPLLCPGHVPVRGDSYFNLPPAK